MDDIRLLQYRNYQDATFELGRHTLFIGPNGSGKTNVVEAIRTISVTKSFRLSNDRDAINWDEDYCRVILRQNEHTFEYVLTREAFGTKKAMKLDGAPIGLSEVYGKIPTVLFSPETMQLIDGAPEERRRFMDTVLSQADIGYLDALLQYRKIIRERRFVLLRIQQGLGAMDELDFWDSEAARTGGYLIEKRQELLAKLNDALTTIYPIFAGPTIQETLVLQYKPTVTAENFLEKLKKNRTYDVKTTSTNTGPHRDELIFLLRDRDVTLFASRGELRRSVLATKMAEAQFLHTVKNTEPVLLLDDVFSELDAERRGSFLATIQQYRTVITTTDTSFITDHTLPDAVIHELPRKEDHGLTQ